MIRKIILASVYTCVGLLCLSSNAIADLIIAEGKPTGQWYNPDRNGEGFYVEVIDTGGNLQLGLAMYTYDEEGGQMWLSGNVPIDSDDVVVTVPVIRTDGPIWGSGYDVDRSGQQRPHCSIANAGLCDCQFRISLAQ